MRLTPLQTEKVLPKVLPLETFLDHNLADFPENGILAITSKIIALCEGRTLPLTLDKETLLQKEADYFLPKRFRQHGTCTITHHAFIGSAGIDESNASGSYVLLPKNVRKNAIDIRHYLEKRFGCKKVGVIITDSHSTPMRRGASGIALAYSGFVGLKDYRNTPDLFGRNLTMEQANVVDALAASAVLVMGEGNEQTPLVIIEDLPNITFDPQAPTKKELQEFFVDLEDDIFSPLFNMKRLKHGGKKSPR